MATASTHNARVPTLRQPLYSDAERARRDATVWTLVQGVLAPLQFVVFLVSLALVIRYLLTGAGYEAATLSIIIKTAVLLTIIVTGAIWEKVVFGEYLFAPAFFWEDVFSFAVIALHLLYVFALLADALTDVGLMYLALAAYAAYVINAAQFVWKLRMARLDDGWCSALDRNAMLCSIYEKRPGICRELETGEYECLTERAARSLGTGNRGQTTVSELPLKVGG